MEQSLRRTFYKEDMWMFDAQLKHLAVALQQSDDAYKSVLKLHMIVSVRMM